MNQYMKMFHTLLLTLVAIKIAGNIYFFAADDHDPLACKLQYQKYTLKCTKTSFQISMCK